MDSHKSGPSNHKIISFSNDILTLVEEYYQIGSCQSCIGCETSSLHVYKCATGCVAYIIIMPSLAQAVRILTACAVCSPLVHSCSIVCAALHSLCGLQHGCISPFFSFLLLYFPSSLILLAFLWLCERGMVIFSRFLPSQHPMKKKKTLFFCILIGRSHAEERVRHLWTTPWVPSPPLENLLSC